MKYINNNLIQGESLLKAGKVHWFVFFSGAFVTLFGGLLLIGSSDSKMNLLVGTIILLVGAISLIKAYFYYIGTELAVTNKRVVAKFGFIKRDSIELNYSAVESITVEQGIVGRILNFGTVWVNGSGGRRAPIPIIVAPLEFRKFALEAFESQNDS